MSVRSGTLIADMDDGQTREGGEAARETRRENQANKANTLHAPAPLGEIQRDVGLEGQWRDKGGRREEKWLTRIASEDEISEEATAWNATRKKQATPRGF